MGKNQILREESELGDGDLEQIRKIHDAALKVVKLGKRWIKSHHDFWQTAVLFPHAQQHDLMFQTFRRTVIDEFFERPNWDSTMVSRLIQRYRTLSDAIDYLECAASDLCEEITSSLVGMGGVRYHLEILNVAREILGEVLDDLEAEESPTLTPVWDRLKRQLSYGEIVCREYQRTAPEQFQILDLFQIHEWPRTVLSPWRDQKKLRDTVDHLNGAHTQESPVRFEVFNTKPAWFRVRRRSGSC
jgi:hypothetical protein